MTQVITVAGQPVVFFDFDPDWGSRMNTQHEYKTDLVTSYDGSEQRRALRQTPRQTQEFRISLKGDRLRSAAVLFDSWMAHLFAVPEYTRFTRTPLPAALGTNTMAIPEDLGWIFVGALVAVQHQGQKELRRITAVDGYAVTFADNTAYAWPAGTILRPAFLGRFGPSISADRPTSDAGVYSVNFLREPADPSFRVYGYTGPMFDGREILTKRPNWGSPQKLTVETDWSVLDFGRGMRPVETHVSYNRRVLKGSFLSRNRDEADEMEAFFYRRRGRRGSFYMPTWDRDLRATQAITNGTTTLVVDSEDFDRFLDGNAAYKRLVIIGRDRVFYPNEILSMTSAAGVTTITVRDPWPRDFSLGDIAAISWLTCARFASDILTISWETSTVSQFELSVQTLADTPIADGGDGGWGLDYGFAWGG